MTETIYLPWPPSVNTYWRNVDGRAILSAKGREYRAATIDTDHFGRRFKGPLRVSIAATAPDQRRRDLDNHLKAPLDALRYAGVYEDDSQIHDLRIYWSGKPSKDSAGLRITIEPIPTTPRPT